MSKFKVRALRAALVVPLLMGRALVASAGHASASINPDNVDRPKISAGDRDFGNKDIFAILSGGIVNWDETDSGTRSMCPKFTPWVSGILYVNNLACSQPGSRSTTTTSATMSCTRGTRPPLRRWTTRNTNTSSATPSTAAKTWTTSSSRSTPSRTDRGRRRARPSSTARRTARATSRRSDRQLGRHSPGPGVTAQGRAS